MVSMVRTTGIGSLPLDNIDDAINYSLRHDIPFFPQLYSIHGNMIKQVLNCNFKFLDLFIEKAKAQKKSLIKIQIAGPTTTKLSKEFYDKCITKIKELSPDIEILFCIDEPIIDKNTIKLHQKFNLYNHFNTNAMHSCAKLSPKDIEPFLKHIDYFFYDSLLNPELINLKKLCPGIVDCKGEVSDLNFSHCEIITTTCGLQGANDLEDIFNKLTSVFNRA